jgi:hypothetical protein
MNKSRGHGAYIFVSLEFLLPSCGPAILKVELGVYNDDKNDVQQRACNGSV